MYNVTEVFHIHQTTSDEDTALFTVRFATEFKKQKSKNMNHTSQCAASMKAAAHIPSSAEKKYNLSSEDDITATNLFSRGWTTEEVFRVLRGSSASISTDLSNDTYTRLQPLLRKLKNKVCPPKFDMEHAVKLLEEHAKETNGLVNVWFDEEDPDREVQAVVFNPGDMVDRVSKLHQVVIIDGTYETNKS